MRLKAPAGMPSITIAGVPFIVPENGILTTTDAAHIEALQSHGFVPADAIPNIDTMTRPELIAAIIAYGRSKLEGESDDTLRAALLEIVEKEGKKPEDDLDLDGDKAKPQEPPAPSDDQGDGKEDENEGADPGVKVDENSGAAELETMNRKQLLAYMAENGVAVALPISTDKLRKAAVEFASTKKAA